MIDLIGIKIHQITEAQAIAHILAELSEGRGGTVVTPNLDHLYRIRTDVSFHALVAQSDLVVADGMPVVWASRLQKTPLPERVAGSTMIRTLSSAAADAGRSIFLLGGDPGTAEGAAKVLTEMYPKLKVVGTFCPPIGFENDPALMVDIASRLIASQPNIVFVALGSPKQERLIERLRRTLPRAWWLGVGISFSFLTGDVKRAPEWLQKIGLEWTHRLVQEPKRLFKRYVMTGIPFAGYLLTRSTIRGIAGTGKTKLLPAMSAVRPLASQVPTSPAAASTAPSTPRRKRVAARQSSVLANLKGLILLGGSVRPSPLALQVGRSVLDMPLDENGSLLHHWLVHAREVAQMSGLSSLPLRVLVDRHSPEPLSASTQHYGAFRVERDQSEYRGTGGVLRDLSRDYDDDAYLVVANAAQVLVDPLTAIVRTLDQKHSDIGLVAHRDGTPSGIMMLRVKALRNIKETGFCDFKEQCLPEISRGFDVAVLQTRKPTGLPVRTLADYILALRLHHGSRSGKITLTDPLAEDWRPSFGIAESGARVDPTARLHDSVVLSDSVIESGAVLVRSVVCGGATVKRDKTIVDQFVLPDVSAKKPQ